MRAWIAWVALFLATPAWAQEENEQVPVFADDAPDGTNQGHPPNQGNYPTVGCPGGCPTGMACSADGVCEQVPSCTGGCPQGMVCSSDGVCEAAPPPPPQPACSCPTGFACSPAGTCVPQAPTLYGRRIVQREPDPEAADRARRRATFGFVSSGVVLALGVTAGIIRSVDDTDDCDSCFHAEMPILFGAALYHGFAGIFTYSGSRAGRRAGGRGNGFLRVMGWVTWVAGLLGLVAGGIIASQDGSEPASFIYAFSAIAALGPLLWAADASIGARQAEELIEARQTQARRWTPALRILREGTNVVGGSLGASIEL